MIHINDIITKLNKTPVPQEVLDMRENILSAFKNLEFIEEGHKYYIHKVQLPDITEQIINVYK